MKTPTHALCMVSELIENVFLDTSLEELKLQNLTIHRFVAIFDLCCLLSPVDRHDANLAQLFSLSSFSCDLQ